jgi:hypothetical protein
VAERTATVHWGTCENCDASVMVFPHPERIDDLSDDHDDWENGGIFASCYVCGGSIDWGGTDPATDLIKNY